MSDFGYVRDKRHLTKQLRACRQILNAIAPRPYSADFFSSSDKERSLFLQDLHT